MALIAQNRSFPTKRSVLLLGSLAAWLALPAGVAEAGCRHTGLSADEVLQHFGERSDPARAGTDVLSKRGENSPRPEGQGLERFAAAIGLVPQVVPVPCDSSAPRVKSVASTVCFIFALPHATDSLPRITWLRTALPRLVSTHPSPADPPPPRA